MASRFTVTAAPYNHILDTARPLHGRPLYCGRFATRAEAIAVCAEVNAKAVSHPRLDFVTLRTWV